jgi:hypothetical protein
VIACSAAVAVGWVFLLPIFQGPDETEHFNYALVLNENHSLVRAPHLGPNDRPNSVTHPYISHLADQSGFTDFNRRAVEGLPDGYGSAAFRAELDRTAPPRTECRPVAAPGISGLYPFGFYAALAVWIEGVRRLAGDGPVELLFGARLFSVVLLAISLALTYLTARDLGARLWTALFLTGSIGCFPMVSFIGSYVQPDNLGMTLVLACFLLARRLDRSPGSVPLQAVLGLALGGLLVTKVHFFAVVSLPTAAMLAARWLTVRPGVRAVARAAALLVTPAVVLGGLHYWLTWPATNYFRDPAPVQTFNEFVLGGLTRALANYFMGATHNSFWGIFGWMQVPLVIWDRATQERVEFVTQAATWVLLGLTLVRLEQVSARLVQVARGGHWRRACQIACSHVPLNSYFLFTVLMVVLFVHTANRFGAQGRNWLPFLLPIFWTGLVYAPAALKSPGLRRAVRGAVAAGLLFFASAGSTFALKSVYDFFYHTENGPLPILSHRALIVGPNSFQRPTAPAWLDRSRETTFVCPFDSLAGVAVWMGTAPKGASGTLVLEVFTAEGACLGTSRVAADGPPGGAYRYFHLPRTSGLRGQSLRCRLTHESPLGSEAQVSFTACTGPDGGFILRPMTEEPAARLKWGRERVNLHGTAADKSPCLLRGVTPAVRFHPPFSTLHGIEVLFVTGDTRNEGRITLEVLTLTGEVLVSSSVEAANLRRAQYQWFPLGGWQVPAGTPLDVRLSYSPVNEERDRVALVLTKEPFSFYARAYGE